MPIASTSELSGVELAAIKILFPEKYQQVLGKAKFERGHSIVPFEIIFGDYRDFYRFILMFDEQDFPQDKFPKGFEIGIFAKCLKCGQINMSGGMDFALIKVNQQSLLDSFKGSEIVCWCLTCLIKYLGPQELIDCSGTLH